MQIKKLKCALAIAALLTTIQLKATVPLPYSAVSALPFNPEGFSCNAAQIRRLFGIRKPKIVIEVGCWRGTSAMHMASMLPPGGKLYAVHHLSGEKSWSPALPRLYEQFLSNMVHAGLTEVVVPMRMSSLEASVALADVKADLIYIDASHDYESVYADLNAWFPIVQGRGILCGDDWDYPDVQKAVFQFADEHNLTVAAPGASLWCLHEQQPHPLGFAMPVSKVISTVPSKDQDFATVIPGDMRTYKFHREEDYYADYQRSYYAITSKKGGWDCLRHYEILANGCIPYFVDLELSHENTMHFLPKELIKEAMALEGVSYLKIDHSKFDKNKYNAILEKLLEHTRKHLTTSAMASHILKTVNYSGNGNILYLTQSTFPDYLRCLTLIGFKELLGNRVVDVPKIEHIYQSYPGNAGDLYGRGMTYTKIVPDLEVSRDNIEARIVNKEFDLIIYGSVHRGMPYQNLVINNYPPEQIIYLCGEDDHSCEYVGLTNLFLREFESCPQIHNQ